jgi:hypothetical protein
LRPAVSSSIADESTSPAVYQRTRITTKGRGRLVAT